MGSDPGTSQDNAGGMDASIAEATPEEVPITRERDKEFWYEDGNVILVAGNVEFRIFKGILAGHSPVFKDMFSLPQPDPTPSETPVPTVHLSDSPLDVRHILRIHMPKAKSNPFKYTDDGPSFNTISASIRLGHKYQMSALVAHAFDYLKEHFPTAYDDWEKYPTYGPPAFDDAHAIAVVNFARAFDQPLLLPSALLACAILPGRILVAGCKREDGSRETLAMEDLARCIHARGALAAASAAGAMRVFKPAVDDQCEQKRSEKCQGALRKMLEGLEGVAKCFGDPCDPTQSHLRLYNDVGKRVCWACHRMLLARNAKERRATWAALPDLLDVKVEGWAAE